MEYIEQLKQKGWDIEYVDTINGYRRYSVIAPNTIVHGVLHDKTIKALYEEGFYNKDQWYNVRTYIP
jgi:hypothetical protein